MKMLGLLRHAKSGWEAPGLRDFDRPLNARGHEAARALGREMDARGLTFDRVVASPAARVAETMAGLEEGHGRKIGASYDERVYLATAATLLDIVHEADDAAGRLLIVGHNPGLERLALLLSGAGKLRDALAIKYPTGALAEISLPVTRWRDVEAGAGRIERFIRPRDLEPAPGPKE